MNRAAWMQQISGKRFSPHLIRNFHDDSRKFLHVGISGSPVRERRPEHGPGPDFRGADQEAPIGQDRLAQFGVEVVQLLVGHATRIVAKGHNIQLHIVHQFQLRRLFDLTRKVLGDIQAVFDDLLMTLPAVCLNRRPDGEAACAP